MQHPHALAWSQQKRGLRRDTPITQESITMKHLLALASALVLTVSVVAAQTAPNAGLSGGVMLSPVRARWPIAREPGGQWGVVGEVVATLAPSDSSRIQAVRLALLDERGRVLAYRNFDTPTALADVVRIATVESDPARWHPPGTTILGPGERAVIFIAELTMSRPEWASLTVDLDGRAPARVVVPLNVYQPAQHLSWPAGPSDRPWLATATPGTPPHSQGGAVLSSGQLFVSQRFALDLRQIDAALRTHPEGAATKEAYYAWGQPVLSMGRGVVVAVVDTDPDYEIGEPIPATQHPAGNYIVVQHGPAAFAVYAHLQRGSIGVRPGQWVERGAPLARVGNSGSTSEPHLHVHVADRWRRDRDPLAAFTLSQGVPALFWGGQVLRDGVWIPLRGATPTEFDIVVPDPQ